MTDKSVVFVLLAVIIFSVYFLPCIIVSWKDEKASQYFAIPNGLLGWTLIGWIALVIWILNKYIKLEIKKSIIVALLITIIDALMIFGIKYYEDIVVDSNLVAVIAMILFIAPPVLLYKYLQIQGLLTTKQAEPSNRNIRKNSRKKDAQLDDKAQEILAIINEAGKTLFQCNDPDYEISLYESLLLHPETTLQVIQSWGWKRRGTASEELNRFLIRAIGEIYKRTEGVPKEKASDTLVQIFTTPDDNTTGWTNLLESAAKIIAKNKMLEIESKLENLKKDVTGRNQQAIEHTLTLLKKV